MRAPTAPPRCGRGANRQLVIWGYAGICGLWLLSTRGTLYDPLPAPRPPLFGGLRFPSRWKGVKNCPHAPGGPSRLLNYPHHAKIKPGLKPGVSLNRRGRPGCAWGDYRGSGMCAGIEAADCYKRRITKHARPKEYPLPSAAMPRVRARLMAAFETIRNALQHPPLSLRNLVLACDHHQNPPHAHPQPPQIHPNAIRTGRGDSQSARRPRRRPAVRLCHRRAPGKHATK